MQEDNDNHLAMFLTAAREDLALMSHHILLSQVVFKAVIADITLERHEIVHYTLLRPLFFHNSLTTSKTVLGQWLE